MAVPSVHKRREVTRWDPLSEFAEIQERMSQLFQGMFPARPALSLLPEFEEHWSPAIDLYETDTEVVLKASMPGMPKDKIDIRVGEQEVMIKGEMRHEEETKEENYYSREMSYGSFYRTIPLPHEVQRDKAKAKLKDGMLEVRIPKAAKAIAGKKVEIES